jgi:hypothetical protein
MYGEATKICARCQSCMQDGNLVCTLKKSVYGLKQVPRAWYTNIDKLFLCNRFKHCESNHSTHFKM